MRGRNSPASTDMYVRCSSLRHMHTDNLAHAIAAAEEASTVGIPRQH